MPVDEPSPLEMIEMVGETVFASARRGDLDSVRRHCLDSDFDPNITKNGESGHGEVAVQVEGGGTLPCIALASNACGRKC